MQKEFQGDQAEDWPSAYIIALEKLQWRNGTKVILHFCDYGTHGEGFSNYDYSPEDKRVYNIYLKDYVIWKIYI